MAVETPTSCLHSVKHQKIKGNHKDKNRYLEQMVGSLIIYVLNEMNMITSHVIVRLKLIVILQTIKLSIRVTLPWYMIKLFWIRKAIEKLWLTKTEYYWTHVLLQFYAAIHLWYIKSNIFMHKKYLILLQIGDHGCTKKWHNWNYCQWRFTTTHHH